MLKLKISFNNVLMRKAKDFAKADSIRQSLLEQGVVLKTLAKVQFGVVLIKRSLDHKSVDTLMKHSIMCSHCGNSSVGRA